MSRIRTSSVLWKLTVSKFRNIILVVIYVGVDWMDLAQDRDQWRALVNTVMNLRVP
jgi:hypothetical protein